jgi:hypothetical protein
MSGSNFWQAKNNNNERLDTPFMALLQKSSTQQIDDELIINKRQ